MWQTKTYPITPGGEGFGATRHRIHSPHVTQSLEGYNITIYNSGDIDLTEIQIRYEDPNDGNGPKTVKSQNLKAGATTTFSVGNLAAAENTNYIEVNLTPAAMSHIVDEAANGLSASFNTLASGREL